MHVQRHIFLFYLHTIELLGIMKGDSDSNNRTVRNLVIYSRFGTANKIRLEQRFPLDD